MKTVREFVPDSVVCPLITSPALIFLWRHTGFVLIRNVVCKPLIDAALNAINHELGKGINIENYHKPKGKPFHIHTQYCPEASHSKAITDCFNRSGACRLVESLLGLGKLKLPGGGQVAPVFPSPPPNPLNPHSHPYHWWNAAHLSKHGGWHIDGIERKVHGHAEDKINNFSLLFGIYLSDASQPFCGNFTVLPGP
jgi:hypothetical protein